MLVDFKKVFCNDPMSDDVIKKLNEYLIDNKSCIICKHARMEDVYELSNYAGQDAWCKITGDLRYGKNGQQCLFWESTITNETERTD